MQPWLAAYAEEAIAGTSVYVEVPAGEMWEVTAVSLIDSAGASLDEDCFIGLQPVRFENNPDKTPSFTARDAIILQTVGAIGGSYTGAAASWEFPVVICWTGRIMVPAGTRIYGLGNGAGNTGILCVWYRRVMAGDDIAR